MKQDPLLFVLAFLSSVLALMIHPGPARAQTAVPTVHAVLFYSPTCGHCHYVITEVLPPLFDRYGSRLQMIGVDVTQPNGQALFLTTLQLFGLDSGGVPFLVVGDTYLIGSVDIPEKFPDLIEHYLAQGGVDWPEIPGLAELITAAQSTQGAQTSPNPAPPTPLPTISDRAKSIPASDPEPATTSESLILTGEVEASLGDQLAQDPAGNGLAIVVLIGMLFSVGWGVRYFRRTSGRRMAGAILWIMPALCIVGLGVAGYLAYVEMAQVKAVCGPVGDCNAVQQSEYARLFGVLPIGVFGMVGDVLILAAWWIGWSGQPNWSSYATLSMFAMTAFGTLFSIYLTFLEPFVIGATCVWCLSSAIIMTILLLLSIAPGKLAVRKLLRRSR
jgi:uncharacterized membrane protein